MLTCGVDQKFKCERVKVGTNEGWLGLFDRQKGPSAFETLSSCLDLSIEGEVRQFDIGVI